MGTRILIGMTLILFFLHACTPAMPLPTETPPAARETATLPPTAEQTSTPSSTPKPTSTSVLLQLSKIETFPEICMEMEPDLPGENLREVAYLPSGFCFHGKLDIFETSGRVYVAQVIQDEYRQSKAAFRIVDVTDVIHPPLCWALGNGIFRPTRLILKHSIRGIVGS